MLLLMQSREAGLALPITKLNKNKEKKYINLRDHQNGARHIC